MERGHPVRQRAKLAYNLPGILFKGCSRWRAQADKMSAIHEGLSVEAFLWSGLT